MDNKLHKPQKAGTIIIYMVIGLFFVLSIYCFCQGYVSTAKHKGVDASQLIRKKTVDGDTCRIDYLDDKGNITYAEDKRYATIIEHLDEDGNVLSEYYFDEDGNPSEQYLGHYGVERKYDDLGRNVLTKYVDKEGNPVNIISGFAAVRKEFDENGNAIKETSLDENLQPTIRVEGYCSWVKEYNEKGQCTRVVYLDDNDVLVNKKAGYAIEQKTLDREGQVSSVQFLGSDGKATQNSLGQYGESYEYDEEGQQRKITFLDRNGNVMMTLAGYAIVEKIYDPDNGDVTEYYYDMDHQPVKLSHGQYGMRREKDGVVYLNKRGNPIFSLDQFLHTHMILAVLAGVIICILTNWLSKPVVIIFLAIYILFVIYMTLMLRESRVSQGQFELFWSYREFFTDRDLRTELLQNIWLFIPVGVLLHSILKNRLMMIIPVIISVAIEITQYYTGRGLFEFDDIISNGLGGCIGFWCGEQLKKIEEYRLRKGYHNK